MADDRFDFGYGLVPAHRHTNGGGWVAETATVADTAYVGIAAQVYGEARPLWWDFLTEQSNVLPDPQPQPEPVRVVEEQS